jgi:hypothetical protein
MTDHLPEHNYLMGERRAELQAALVEDKRVEAARRYNDGAKRV